MSSSVVVSPDKLQVPPGAVLRLPATWQQYQQLMRQRGDGSVPRMKYCDGAVLLMSPLPVHGRDSSLLADIVKTLLDHTGREYDSFTPVTMDLPDESGVEPDYCFYIDNWPAVSGKARIDWQQDPPPDLAIEVDVTSYSNVADYVPYRIPEIWLWKKQRLQIYGFQGDAYAVQARSRWFPEWDVVAWVELCMREAGDRNTSFAIRNLRQRLSAGDVS
ncbi:MAG: Uma2 family endonuclease [Synechococcales cyanobacterium RU_4_20]|nr:Uma2 family endonuclease [Synechococcales cyanobacterium RU_4_20]NJR67967.1 Uma2 family endonuclease [Synechococcales cyanobacterium CRU_2_2]